MKKRDPIPERFDSIEEAGRFWDTHDLTDYWDQTHAVDFRVDIRARRFPTNLEPPEASAE